MSRALADICTAIVDCEHKTAPTQPWGIPSIRTTDIKGGRIDFSRANKVSETTYQEWTARLEPQSGDLILAREAPVGEVGFIPKGQRACLGQRTVLLRLDFQKVDSKYIHFLLLSPALQHEMISRSDGSVVPHLNMSDIRGLKLPTLPPLPEQKAIAHVLGTLDDKIENNRRMNETLEAMARAIFKSWFVDFDPVRAKADGRPPDGMDADTAALFPDRFEDSALGKIPAGWDVKNFGGFVTRYRPGKLYDKKTVTVEGKIPVLDQGKSGVIGYHDNEPGFIASRSDPVIIFANHTCYMRLVHFPFSTIQNVIPMKGNDVATLWAFYAAIDKQPFLEYKGHWPDFVINESVVPIKELAERFADIIKPLTERVYENERESINVASTRDALLPKLLSGEVRVKGAVAMVGVE